MANQLDSVGCVPEMKRREEEKWSGVEREGRTVGERKDRT
jgi:hypothetical protein